MKPRGYQLLDTGHYRKTLPSYACKELWSALYATPEPLTDLEIARLWRKCCERNTKTTAELMRNFTRAIERRWTGVEDE